MTSASFFHLQNLTLDSYVEVVLLAGVVQKLRIVLSDTTQLLPPPKPCVVFGIPGLDDGQVHKLCSVKYQSYLTRSQ